ncbi:uncharacterized protein FA14DRAFT_189999 [Meira miltonrushii]|uniref:Uncharacterized protein n=1 Tax=Meira miltonrushii TaxID=1280837 RepID=A0A316VJ76_9BASI|nr:uncharacterized protein FA14DRAFT_189999 [Meira miltonrushii]PWN36081.1 hypothetical protein FA14DRAFT_189999 [Meira miltonrushii]
MMSASAYSGNELFPFPLSPPSLDSTRRRRAPSALKLGAAYQKRIPRTFRKFHSPIHPNDLSAESHCVEEVKTGRLVVNHSKIGTVRRYSPETVGSPTQKDSKEFQIKRGEQMLFGSSATSPSSKSSTGSSSPSKTSIDDSATLYDGISEGEKVERRMIYKQINALLEAS